MHFPAGCGIEAIMKDFSIAFLSLALVLGSITAARADIPQAFDPRTESPEPGKVVGSAFLVNATPLGDYLIVTRPFENNPKHEFLTFAAKLKPALALKPEHIGHFVLIEAKPIKKRKPHGPAFEIRSVTAVTDW